MIFLFDTDHITFLQRAGSPEGLRIRAQIAQHPNDDLYFSIVSFHEQIIGCHGYINQARRPAEILRGYQLLLEILTHYQRLPVVPFGAAELTRWDQLVRQHPRVGRMDLRIAAIALEGQMTVVTRNRADFGGIPGLSLVDWTV